MRLIVASVVPMPLELDSPPRALSQTLSRTPRQHFAVVRTMHPREVVPSRLAGEQSSPATGRKNWVVQGPGITFDKDFNQ
jgi:hypothetical protein